MMEYIDAFFDYAVQYSNSIFAAYLLFCFFLKKRSFFWLRLGLSAAVWFVLMTVLGFEYKIRYMFNSPYNITVALGFLFITVLAGFLCLVSFKMCWKEVLFCGIAACSVQSIASNVASCIYLYALNEFMGKRTFEFIVICIVYAAAYFLFAKRMKTAGALVHIKSYKILFVSLVLIVVNFLINFLYKDGTKDAADDLTKMLLTLFVINSTVISLLVLFLQFGYFGQSKLEQDNQVLDELIRMQGKQQQLSKETIDQINLKCHDIKKQIALLIDSLASFDEKKKFVDEVQKTVAIYEETANTGNEALDVLLTEKLRYCLGQKIRFSYIADGGALSFMDSADIWSLVGNALDNAAEAVKDEAEEHREISFKLGRRDNLLKILTVNYCAVPPQMVNGLPVSTKRENKNYHGFGMSSMRYIVEKYGGGMNIYAGDGIFRVSIVIPVPRDPE